MKITQLTHSPSRSLASRWGLGVALGMIAVLATACPAPPPESAPTTTNPPVGETLPAVVVTSGATHSCALFEGGTVRCWGSNAVGQLGNGTTIDTTTPVDVVGISNATQVAAGAITTCALLDDPAPPVGGSVVCWGYGGMGALGNGSYLNSSLPVQVYGIQDAVQIAVGGQHACALRAAGTIRCWGNKSPGQLGNFADAVPPFTPVDVIGIADAQTVSAGAFQTCASRTGAWIKCWGLNLDGQLGSLPGANSVVPVEVPGLDTPIQVDASRFDNDYGGSHACAVDNGGAVECWGENLYGEVGDGTRDNTDRPPTQVAGVLNAYKVTTGRDHTCSLSAAPTAGVRCWGSNGNGQLGVPKNPLDFGSWIYTPSLVQGIDGVTQVSAGSQHTCARLSGGAVKCWGDGFYGQLGNGQSADSFAPVSVVGIGSGS